ncbi:exosortase F system-associated protein [Sungkyunkwania multivorans]|uniref:Exosortase F system-associated protein n=1 Tax=Sungkyunkwania multivorans TaxID=1173618 RepID=A0ABW3D432_9FLAO
MSIYVKYLLAGLLFLVLIAIRAFEYNLFYDPFLNFFKYDYLTANIPAYDNVKLFFNHLFRYGLNMAVSLTIIYVAFENRQVIRFASLLYAIAFVILIIGYFYLIEHDLQRDYLLTFYVRRFLIQPIFVIILLPAFYYQRKIQGKES